MATFVTNALSPETQEVWNRTETYNKSFLIPKDEVLEKIEQNNKANGLMNIAITPSEGKFLHLLARSIGAKRILEVGTLGGYSTAWLARAVPDDGKVTTLELNPHHVKVATENLTDAGLIHKVDIILGPASETLENLSPSPAPFDMVFIDADKEGNVAYYNHAKRLLRKGGIIIVDNVVFGGRVSDLENKHSMFEGIRKLLEAIKTDSEVSATVISTAGERGYDGFAYILKL